MNSMDTGALLTFLQESLFLIVVYVAFLGYSMLKGTQALVNVTLALYLALLISLKFPYYSFILGGAGNPKTESILTITVFAVFTLFAQWLFNRLMPPDTIESTFEYFGKKLLFAAGAAILVMAFSYHALPVTELITIGSPISYLFAPEANFFWWLLVPLVLLFLL